MAPSRDSRFDPATTELLQKSVSAHAGVTAGQVHLIELVAREAETAQRIAHKNQVAGANLVLTIGLIAAAATTLNSSTPVDLPVVRLFLLYPLMAAILAARYFENDAWMSKNGRYIERVLRPRLAADCNCKVSEILGWEEQRIQPGLFAFIRARAGSVLALLPTMGPAIGVLAVLSFQMADGNFRKKYGVVLFDWTLLCAGWMVTAVMAVYAQRVLGMYARIVDDQPPSLRAQWQAITSRRNRRATVRLTGGRYEVTIIDGSGAAQRPEAFATFAEASNYLDEQNLSLYHTKLEGDL